MRLDHLLSKEHLAVTRCVVVQKSCWDVHARVTLKGGTLTNLIGCVRMIASTTLSRVWNAGAGCGGLGGGALLGPEGAGAVALGSSYGPILRCTAQRVHGFVWCG